MFRILIAESNEQDKTNLVTDLLGTVGEFADEFEIETSTSTEQTLSKLSQNKKYDILIVDLNVSDTSGWKLIDKVRNIKKVINLPILLISEDYKSGIQYGAIQRKVSLLAKPFCTEDLIKRIKFLSSQSNKSILDAIRDVKKTYDDFSDGVAALVQPVKR